MLEDNKSYLKDLNEAQLNAVLKTDGPSMVIAGAGSGKTRVLTYKIVHLINNSVDPFEILALTFTNKAAKEMKLRISSMIGESESKNIWMGTFHSVFAKILRFEAHKIGFTSDFTIYDVQDSERLISSIIKEKNLDKDIYKSKSIRNRISSLKNSFITVNGYFSNDDLVESDNLSRKPETGNVYKEYNERLVKSNSMDFDDLLMKTNELINNHPEVLAKYQEKFKYILVDEYQDTNHSQYLIVKSLSDKYQNICVVGDDAQSIYSFRGANINNIINFRNDYDNVEVFRLEQNYRSTKNIVNAANSVIDHNKNKIDKEVWTDNDFGDKVEISSNQSDIGEARGLCQKVISLNNTSFSDIAILYRTNAQSRPIEDSLRINKIPYQIFGGVSFYNRKEIKDVLAYLRLIVNSSDEESLKRVINYPARGIGQVTINKIILAAQKYNLTLYETIKKNKELSIGFSSSVSIKLENFIELIDVLKIENQKLNAFDLTKELINKVRIVDELKKDDSPEGISRLENVQELLNGIRDFIEDQKELVDSNDNLSEFLSTVALSTDFDTKDLDEDKVSLMTLHLSKGLEFKHVFIVGLEEDLFPSALSYNTRSELEEERRLFYVGITRAKENLYLSYANSRYRWGKLIYCEESRFLNEIDKEFVKLKKSNNLNSISDSPLKKVFYKPNPNLKRLSRNTPINANLKINFSEGENVSHEKFGTGKIVKIEGFGNDTKAIVKFKKFGEKNLLLRFAKLNKA
ncbi:MAG: ATP-dependent DNA helicase PcrA [Flavobacteriales bacterium]|nr:MAG: ATP-dependent DNA helicase PcrA [Flavobacteriales bacterium]|tara:strand:- start:5559 stop:7796 length:2238 start_codon:yes stop_codon:yes gene_type:complete